MFSRLNVVMKIKSLSVLSVAVLAAFFALGAASAQEPTRLLRYPDVFGGDVVFCYGGDLWKASLDGGQARRLTAHPGQELFPKFSPDGKWIAFTSQYDGDEQVYVIPAEGGEPRRLEHNDLRWITAEEIGNYDFCPADEEILKEIRRRKGCCKSRG